MNRFKLINARSLEEASRLIKGYPAGDAVLMAGGTDLLVLRRNGLIQPKLVVRIDWNPKQCGCQTTEDGGLLVGAFTTLDDIVKHPLVQKNYPMLAQAAGAVASSQIRHKATIGGNVCLNTRCWFYNKSAFWRTEYPDCRKAFGGNTCYVVPESRKGCFALQSGDTVGPLVALDARLKLVSDKGERLGRNQQFLSRRRHPKPGPQARRNIIGHRIASATGQRPFCQISPTEQHGFCDLYPFRYAEKWGSRIPYRGRVLIHPTIEGQKSGRDA